MQKFTRNLTREITVAGERLALTLSEEGVSIRSVGTRRPPLQLSWAACLVAASKNAPEPPMDEVNAVVQAMVPARKPTTGSSEQTPEPAMAGASSHETPDSAG